MTDYFISVYYNYFEDPEREKLCKEFIERYPHVILYEIAYGDKPYKINAPYTVKYRYPIFNGFINNRIINDFVRTHDDIKSLTFMDCDIEVSPYFFKLLRIVMDKYKHPVFIQPFSSCEEIHKNKKILTPPVVSSAKNYYEGHPFTQNMHTGYIYSFNKAALDKIGRFPEELVLGSFDTFLHLSLYKRKDIIEKLITEPKLQELLLDFYDRMDGVHFDYVAGVVKHFEHGCKAKRYHGRFELYNKGVTDEVMMKYFAERDSFDSPNNSSQ